MPRVLNANDNFIGGKTPAEYQGRYSSILFQNGLAECENFIIRPEGGAFSRPGTEERYDGYASSRLIAFKYSNTENFQLLFEPDGNLRILKCNEALSGNRLLDTKSLGFTGGLKLREMGHSQARDSFIFATKVFTPKS